MSFFLPPPSAYKILVPETVLSGGGSNPQLAIPAGVYKTLRVIAKFRGTTNNTNVRNIVIAPFFSTTPSCIPLFTKNTGGVGSFGSPGIVSGNPLAVFMGLNASAGSFAWIDYTIYDCDKTTPKLAIGYAQCVDNPITVAVNYQWTEYVINNIAVDGFRLLTGGDNLDVNSSYRVYQLE